MFKKSALSLVTLSLVTANLLFNVALAASVANWPSESSPSDVRVNATTTSHQMEPVMVQTSDGNYILAWSDYRAGARPDIYAQKISATDGSSLWGSDVAVATLPPGTYEGAPIFLEPDNSGGVFIGWTECNIVCADNTRVPRVQKLNSSGVAQWTAGGVSINTSTTLREEIDDIYPDGSGGLYIALNKSTATVNDADTAITRLDSSGNVHSSWNTGAVDTYRLVYMPEAQVDRTEYGSQILPDQSGNIFITYGFINSDLQTKLYIAKLDNTGSFVWSGGTPSGTRLLDTSSLTEEMSEYSAVVDGSGGIYIAINNEVDIRISQIHSDGSYNDTSDWEETPGVGGNQGKIVYSSLDGYSDIFVTADSSGGNFYVVYSAYTPDEVYVQKFDSDAQALWNSGNGVIISDDSNGDGNDFDINDFYVNFPVAVTDGAGGLIVAFESYEPSAFINKVKSDGTVDWGDGGTQLGQGLTFDQPNTIVAPAADGGAIVAFNADASGDEDVYVQYFTSDGSSGGGTCVGGGNVVCGSQEIECPDLSNTFGTGVLAPADFQIGDDGARSISSTNDTVYSETLNSAYFDNDNDSSFDDTSDALTINSNTPYTCGGRTSEVQFTVAASNFVNGSSQGLLTYGSDNASGGSGSAADYYAMLSLVTSGDMTCSGACILANGSVESNNTTKNGQDNFFQNSAPNDSTLSSSFDNNAVMIDRNGGTNTVVLYAASNGLEGAVSVPGLDFVLAMPANIEFSGAFTSTVTYTLNT